MELCGRFMAPKDMAVLQAVSLEPPRVPTPTGNYVADTWNEMENNLRLALAKIRAENMKKSFDAPVTAIRPEALQAARTAVTMENPLAAEKYLDEFRMDTVSRLAGVDGFSTDAIIAYKIELALLERMQRFTEEAGQASYHKIYDKILEGGSQ
jgi:hypothetical protein